MATSIDVVLDLGVPLVSCGTVIPAVGVVVVGDGVLDIGVPVVLVVEDGVGVPGDSN